MNNEEKHPHWFEPIADHLGAAYLRYSFTYGTENEVARLYEILELNPGDRLLDVGCGPGRHSHLLAEKGIDVLGVDISKEFIKIANGEKSKANFLRQDVREMNFENEFDAVISMCQGGFGLLFDPTSTVENPDIDFKAIENMARALKPGGKLALSAFSSYFQVKYLSNTDQFTPRELRLMTQKAGLVVKNIWSVTPNEYELLPCNIENPEFLLLAEKAS